MLVNKGFFEIYFRGWLKYIFNKNLFSRMGEKLFFAKIPDKKVISQILKMNNIKINKFYMIFR